MMATDLERLDRDMHRDSAVGGAAEGVAVAVVRAVVRQVMDLGVEDVLVEREAVRAGVAAHSLAWA